MDTYDKLYFDFLIDLIDSNGKIFIYHNLLEDLYNTQFVWLPNIPLDENRAVDGIQLRAEYAKLLSPVDAEQFMMTVSTKPCSVLEMFVAFADRLTFIVSSMDRQEYFWLFIENLGLNSFSDVTYNRELVNLIIQSFLYGTKVHPNDINPPLLFPCREVYSNLDKDLYMQANYYLKSYFL